MSVVRFFSLWGCFIMVASYHQDNAPLTWPFPSPIAQLWGERLAVAAKYLSDIVTAQDVPTELSSLIDVALRQPGKLLISGVARGEPLHIGNGTLWSFHAMLAYAAIAHADRSDAPQVLWEASIPVAVAVELLGTALDIFDDIQDGDGALLRTHSVPMLINAAMALRECAQVALGDTRLPVPLQAALSHAIASDTLRSVGGQTMDIAFEALPEVTLDAALAMTERKSGSLVGLVYRTGAMAGAYAVGLGVRRAKQLGDLFAALGRNLGVILQLENDLHDAQVHTTKSDRQRGKKTLPLVVEAQKAPDTLSATERAFFVESAIHTIIGLHAHRARTQLAELVATHQVSDHWLHWLVDD